MAMKKMILSSTAILILSMSINTMETEAATLSDTVFASGAGAAVVLDSQVTSDSATSEAISYWGYENLGIVQVDKYLNVRDEPSLSGALVGKMPNNSACEIISIADGWAYITSGDVTGYISTDYLLTGADAVLKAVEAVQTVAVVNVDALKVREFPNTDCQTMTTVPEGEELEYIDTEDEWVKIQLDDTEAYVYAEYVNVESKLTTAITLTQLLYGEGVSELRVDLCEFAKQYLGNKYVWGGTSLTSGVDCSGFVMKVFEEFGYSLPHSSRSQSTYGTQISASEAQPGDLFFYSSNGTINHVAIYIGNGQVIHASNEKYGIRITSSTYRTPTKVVRILP